MIDMLLAVPLGVLIGLTLGALGGGGSILTVPALVYVLGETARQATTASLVIVGISAVVGAVAHSRAGRVRWGAGIVFGLVGVAGSVLGSHLNHAVNPDILLLTFAVLMALVAAGTLRGQQSSRDSSHEVIDAEPNDSTPPPYPEGDHPGVDHLAVLVNAAAPTGRALPVTPVGAVIDPGATTGSTPAVALAKRPVARTADPPAASRQLRAIKILTAGTVVGVLTGFFGVGGGFVIVPVLTMTLGYAMPEAVGTSLIIIVVNSAASLAVRAGGSGLHWAVIVPFTLAAIAGSLSGNQIASRVPARRLTVAFGVLLLLVAGYGATRSVLQLT